MRYSALSVMLKATEGKLLLTAIILILLSLAALLAGSLFAEETYRTLMAVTGANIIFGRAAGLSVGFASQMNVYGIIALNMWIETLMVLLVYPLFILSWNQLLNIDALETLMQRFKAAAAHHKPTIERYGSIGLFLFVWFPFWMTGPTVGSIIGYLLGLSHTRTLLIVLMGTNVAIIVWAALLYLLKHHLESVNPNAFWLVVALIVIGVLAAQLWRYLKKKKQSL